MYALWSGLGEAPEVMICLSIMLFAGFIVTRLTKLLRLPNVSGFILAGVLIGPYVLNAVPPDLIGHMGFIPDIALGFIAFDVGRYFTADVLRRSGRRVILITLAEALPAGVLVALAMKFVFGMDTGFSLLIGAIATATAPASTMMTIRQYGARGEFVDTLLQVVALDDVVCLLAFSIASAAVSAGSGFNAKAALVPVLLNVGAMALGLGCGFVLSKLLTRPGRSRDNRLILTSAVLLGLSGVCSAFNVSPLLACMILGAVYVNRTGDTELFDQVCGFTPPLMSMFFIVSGMNLNISALGSFGIVGVAYFLVRIAGKYCGAYCGCALARTSRPTRDWLGFALVPQAGVAIGLAFLGQRLLPAEAGSLLLTIILSSSVLYELVGPVCARLALFRSGSVTSFAAEQKAGNPHFLRRRFSVHRQQ